MMMLPEDFFGSFDSARLLRRFVPESQRDNPLAEYWELWSVEHDGATAQIALQIFPGNQESGDNGYDVFVQATSANSTTITRDAVRDILARHHKSSVARGFAVRR